MERSKQQMRKPSHLLIEVATRGIHSSARCIYTYDDQSVLQIDLGGRRTAIGRSGKVLDRCACAGVV